MKKDSVGKEYKEYMVLTLVLGVIVLVSSIVFLHEGLIAVAIPLLIIPSTYLIGLKINSIELLRRYVLYGLFLSVILELVLFVISMTITGKAFSLSIGLGILIYLLYHETCAWLNERRNKTCKRTTEYAERGEMKDNDNVETCC